MGITSGQPLLEVAVLDGIAILIIGFAVVETSKFIAEEELYRKRELRSIHESRRSLTKFVTIIVIAASLEALVMIFKANQSSISDAIYPAFLFIAAMLGQMALGVYQWLSSRSDEDSNKPEKAHSLESDGQVGSKVGNK
jgi:hypothetical protein